MDFEPTRAAGLARLAAYLPRAGRAYAATRNTDRGPSTAPTTSGLSPWLRRRLLTEHEVVTAALDAHGPGAAEKFVQEVFWRTYFKGHLETRPAIWTDYQQRLATARARLDAEPGLATAYRSAVEGRTGIDCFDAWARELTTEHWLHNHTRMWFASIWIFTLGLPWTLGTAHFHQQLIDGDPASNTLSWRWVAGLHTRGKHYVARADNIRRYTDGRFDPRGLNEHPDPLDEPAPPAARALPPAAPAPAGDVALLIHLEDLHPESLPLTGARVRRVATLAAHAPGTIDEVRAADTAALADAAARAAAHFGAAIVPDEPGWNGNLSVVTAYAPIGPTADVLPRATIGVRRTWDSEAWPRCTRGFFALREAIPRVLDAVA